MRYIRGLFFATLLLVASAPATAQVQPGRKGELHQYLREKEQALEDYEKALTLDEKVGVKRKTRQLREDLNV